MCTLNKDCSLYFLVLLLPWTAVNKTKQHVSVNMRTRTHTHTHTLLSIPQLYRCCSFDHEDLDFAFDFHTSAASGR